MKRILIAGMLALVSLAGCNKRVTPNKIEKIITQDKWKIQRFIDNGVNLKDTFALDIFVFDEDHSVLVENRPEEGSWELTSDKSPGVIDINLPTYTNLAYLADDWNMIFLNKNEFHLERRDGKLDDGDLLYFIRLQ